MERHRFDPLSFVFGLLLGALGLAFLVGDLDVGDLDLSWIWPLPLVALGLAMLLAAVRRGGDRDATTPPPEAAGARADEGKRLQDRLDDE